MPFIVFRLFLPNQLKVNCILKFKADSLSTCMNPKILLLRTLKPYIQVID